MVKLADEIAALDAAVDTAMNRCFEIFHAERRRNIAASVGCDERLYTEMAEAEVERCIEHGEVPQIHAAFRRAIGRCADA